MRQDKILNRERINKELDNLFDYPLTIVSATMGYGKTTSVRSYLSTRDVQTIWVSVLGSDGMEDVFWCKLSAAVERVYPETGRELKKLGFPIDAKQADMAINLIWEAGIDKETVLVIDDYHIIDGNKQLGNLIEQVVQEGIPKFHIVLISRTRPKLNHINLLSKGLCHYIDADTLAFTLRELTDYLILMDCSIIHSDIERIHNYTNGWISAVYLIILGLKQGFPVNEVSNINLLVEENLFRNLDSEAKELLLKLAVLDSFTMQQAVEVIENPLVSQIINYLEEKNAFIEYDRQTGVYKLHNVLLDFLRERLAISGMDVSPIYYRAGKWYLKHEEISTAFDYYHRVGKAEELLEYLNGANDIYIGYLGYELMQKIYMELPDDLCIKYPFTFLQMARNFFNSGCYPAVKQGTEIVDKVEKYYLNFHGLPERLRNRILGEVEVAKIFIVFNDAEKMVEHSRKACELLNGGISRVVLRHNKFTFGLPHFLYTYYREAGKLKETVDCIQEGFPPTVFDGCGIGCQYTALAEYALEKGDMQNAEFYAQKSIYKARTRNQIGIILCGRFTLMRLAILKGDAAGAKELLFKIRNELIGIREQMGTQNYAVYNSTLDMCEGYIYGCLKMPDMIPEWLKTGDKSSVALMLQGMAFPDIIRGKAALLSGNWVELEILCESFKEDFQVFHNQLGILHNLIYEAAAKFHLYGPEEGMASLLPALKDGQADGIILPFAENADFILPMLYELQRKNMVDGQYMEALIKTCESYSKTLRSTECSTPVMTEREIQVLRLLSKGFTRQEVADRLYLSVSTIKRYIENIYHKLDANNRVAAIRKAEKLNIL